MTELQMVKAVKKMAASLDDRINDLNRLVSARHGGDASRLCGELEGLIQARYLLNECFEGVE